MKRSGTVCHNCGGARVWIPKRFGRSSSARKCLTCDHARPPSSGFSTGYASIRASSCASPMSIRRGVSVTMNGTWDPSTNRQDSRAMI